MAGIKINQYPLERLTFGDDDYYDIDYWNGSAFETAKIKGSVIKTAIQAGISSANIMDTNSLVLAGNFTHDLNSNNLVLDDGSFRITNGSLGVLGAFNATHDGALGNDIATFISSLSNPVMVLNNNLEAVSIGSMVADDGAVLDITSDSKALLIPRLTTTQRDNITTPIESMLIYNSTTNQFEFRSSGGTWDALGGGAGGFGKFGITNSSGEYTYYTTIELALAGASSGDTIEQFADVSVSTNGTLTFDKDITWNMNGYEYKNTCSSGANFTMIQMSNSAVELIINNGQIIRNTGSTNFGILLDTGNTASNKLYLNGVIINNVEGQSLNGKCEVFGGVFRSGLNVANQNGISYLGILNSVKVYSARRNNLSGTACKTYNSFFFSTSDYTRLSGGAKCYNTIFESTGSYGVLLSVNSELNNCYAKTSAFAGINNQGGIITNCTGFSSGGFGIELGAASTGRAFNCVGSSLASNGFSINGLAEAYNCTALATSSYAVAIQNNGKFKNGTAKSTYNNANGHGIFIGGVPGSGGGFEIVGCEIITANASANGIDGVPGAQGKYAQNSFKGMTTVIGLTTSNLATNTTDSQGNLLL